MRQVVLERLSDQGKAERYHRTCGRDFVNGELQRAANTNIIPE